MTYNLLPSTAQRFLPPKAQLAIYLQPSDATVRPNDAKPGRRDVDNNLPQSQPLSGKFESTLYYMRDRGMAEVWGDWNFGDREGSIEAFQRTGLA